MIRIKKYQDLIIPCRGHIGMAGYYRLEAVNSGDGRSRWLTPWFHNNITNAGLDLCATSTSRYGACQVGTGNAEPDDSDTTLQTFLAGTDNDIFISRTGSGAPDYYWESYIRYDFATGAATGNISEVGIGPSKSSGSTLFSRELIRDGSGNATTITIASTEALRVHYKIRHYPPLVDVTGTVDGTVDGADASRGFTRRACAVGSGNNWGATEGGRTATCTFGNRGGLYSGNTSIVCTGDIGAITASNPSGTNYQSTGATTNSYSPGSFSRSYFTTWNTATANASLKSAAFDAGGTYTGFGDCHGARFQVAFDTTLDKTNLQTLTLESLISWGRYVEP